MNASSPTQTQPPVPSAGPRSGLPAGAPPRLSLSGISKRYPGVLANDDISLAVAPGEIHAVLGENGAGKSTLMKIIYGSVKPDAGEIRVDGTPVRIRDPQHARSLGIGMVFQHFNLFDTLTVAENVWLGLARQPGLADLTERIVAKANEYGLDVDPLRPVHTLSVGEMQRVEIIRALLTEPRMLILDEPTSVLTPQAADRLFEVLRNLSEQGVSILYISHKLHEIRALCSVCTVLRAGRVTGVCDPRQESNASLSRLMIGTEPPALVHQRKAPGETALFVDRLALPRAHGFGVDLDMVSLKVRAGEIVGLAGVSGNGQKELLDVIVGEDRRMPQKTLRLFNKSAGRFSVDQRRALGLHFVPEERLGRGAVPSLSLAENLLLTRRESVGWLGLIDTAALREQARSIVAQFKVKAAGEFAPAASLSGGNLQKYIVGREVSAQPKLLVVSQPTWGVDVGAAAQIRGELLRLRDAGCAVLVVSEELDELFELADRLVVMAKGRLSPPIERADANVALIGEWMSGLWPTVHDSVWDSHVAA
ncbi:MAG: ABC transporter ATP-binding protein [Burkholderiales bacterium]